MSLSLDPPQVHTHQNLLTLVQMSHPSNPHTKNTFSDTQTQKNPSPQHTTKLNKSLKTNQLFYTHFHQPP